MATSSSSNNSPRATSTVWSAMPDDLTASRLPDPASFDVVVVGAGIVGLTTGLLAARAGLRVAVVEAREPGAGTTGRSTAKASLLQGATASEILRRHGEGVLRHYVEANRAGLELLTSNLQGSGVPWEQRDAWTYAADGPAGERIDAEAAALRRVGVEAELAATDELPLRPGAGSGSPTRCSSTRPPTSGGSSARRRRPARWSAGRCARWP